MIISLAESVPLIRTRFNLIYQHPARPDALIKIRRTDSPELKSWLHGLRSSVRRFGAFRDWALEQATYVEAYARLRQMPHFLPQFYGYAATDLGIGYVVQKIVDEAGALSPTFSQACKDGLDADLGRHLVNQFIDDLLRAGIVAGDLHGRNVVLAGNRERLVLVDGLGDKRLIKIRNWSAVIRRRSLEKRRRHFLALLTSGKRSPYAVPMQTGLAADATGAVP